MVTKYSKTSIKLGILLVGLGLLVAGCDSAGPSAEDGDDGDGLVQVTDDLGDRMTTFGDGESNAVTLDGPKAGPKFTLRTRAQIEPPTSARSASHIAYDDSEELVFVGYKVPGATFGGGVDILDASSPTNLALGDQSLRSSDLDVQEVAYDGNDNLYMAGAVDFGNIPARDFGNTPATIVQADIDASSGGVTFPGSSGSSGNVSATEVAMPNRLVKALALPKSPTSAQTPADSDIYAITDSSVVFGFDSNLGSRVSSDAVGSTGEELRSISAFGPSGFDSPAVLGLGTFGEIFRFDTGESNPNLDVLDTITFPAVGDGTLGDPSDFGISRLESTNVSGISAALGTDEVLHFIGVNGGNGDGGIRVLSKFGEEIRYGTNFQAYVSVTAAVDSDDNLRVFAGSPGGTIDVFEGTDGLQWTAKNPGSLSSEEALQAGLELQGSFDLSGLGGDVDVADAQINQIEFHEAGGTEYLYVATSTEGVVVLEIDEDASDIF
jgi:hypothetical protein